MDAKYLGQAYDQPEQIMSKINNYTTRLSALPFLTSIPEKVPWAVLRSSHAIHKVHPSAKAVPANRRIKSLGTSIETFKGESITIKEEGGSNAGDAGVQYNLWDKWLMYMYPLVFTDKVKRYLEVLRVLCLTWCKRKVIHGIFK